MLPAACPPIARASAQTGLVEGGPRSHGWRPRALHPTPWITSVGASSLLSPSHRRLEPLGGAPACQVSLGPSPFPARRLSPEDPWAAAGAPTAEAIAWAEWVMGQHHQTGV